MPCKSRNNYKPNARIIPKQPTIQVQHCFKQLEVRGRPSKPYNWLQAGSSGRTASDCRQVSTSLNTVLYYSPILQSYIGYFQNSPISDIFKNRYGAEQTNRLWRYSEDKVFVSSVLGEQDFPLNRLRCGCPCPSNFSWVEATSR